MRKTIFIAVMAVFLTGYDRAAAQTDYAPQPGDNARPGTNSLRIHFREAPLDDVLEYLADAGGFVIDKQAEVRGTIDAWSKDPVTKAEAVAILNSALRKNGYAVLQKGRILTVVRMDDIKTADLEVATGSDPEQVSRSDEVITQVIPVRHASAAQLAGNLGILLPQTASLTANESANSLVLVAAKKDIHRMLRIIRALDSSMASVSTVRVFALAHADARQVSTVIQQLFAPSTPQQGGAGRRGQFFGPGGSGGGFPGGPPGGAGNGTPSGQAAPAQNANAGASRGSAAVNRVVTAADETSNSLIVSAPSDLMEVIEEIVKQVDIPVSDVTELRVFRLYNADPNELAEQLAELFPNESANRAGNNQSQGGIRFGGGFPAPVGGGFPQPQENANSERTRKQATVIAVPDARTSSLIVSAAVGLMPQIAAMIAELDASRARREVVRVFELKNANPNQVNQIMRDLFNRNSSSMGNRTDQSLQENDALGARQTQQQQQQTPGNQQGFGTGGFGGGPAGAGGGGLP